MGRLMVKFNLQAFIFTQAFRHGYFVAQVQVLNRVKIIWIQFSFQTGYLTKDKKNLSLPNYLPTNRGKKKRWTHTFPNCICV